MSANSTEVTCTSFSVQVQASGTWVACSTTGVMISSQLHNGILIALSNGADNFAMTDLSGSAIISGGDILITDFITYLLVPIATFE